MCLLVIAALYLASYESESPENHLEKDRWKTLRFVSEATPHPHTKRTGYRARTKRLQAKWNAAFLNRWGTASV